MLEAEPAEEVREEAGPVVVELWGVMAMVAELGEGERKDQRGEGEKEIPRVVAELIVVEPRMGGWTREPTHLWMGSLSLQRHW